MPSGKGDRVGRLVRRLRGVWCQAVHDVRCEGRLSVGRGCTFSRAELRAAGDLNIGGYCEVEGLVSIGQRGVLKDGSKILANISRGGSVTMGSECSLGLGSILFGAGGIVIGDQVRIAPYVCVITSSKGYKDAGIPIDDQPAELAPVTIGDDVWIGAHAVILMGVSVGTGAVIGAGAVVTKDVEPYSIVAGSPAREISRRGE